MVGIHVSIKNWAIYYVPDKKHQSHEKITTNDVFDEEKCYYSSQFDSKLNIVFWRRQVDCRIFCKFEKIILFSLFVTNMFQLTYIVDRLKFNEYFIEVISKQSRWANRV